MVERMRQRADELARRIARQLRIGVQSDHESDVAERPGIADDPREIRARTGSQQVIERRQLASFAFVTHPRSFARIPAARPVQQEEHVIAFGRVFPVHGFDREGCARQQRIVQRLHFGIGIQEIGEQGAVQIRIAIGQIAHFQRLDQRVDGIDTGQHGRYHHQRPRGCGYAVAEIHPWQRARADQQGDCPVHQRDTQLAEGDDAQPSHQPRQPMRRRIDLPLAQQAEQECRDDRGDAEQIQQQRNLARLVPDCRAERSPHRDCTLQLRQACIDQEPADVGHGMFGSPRIAHRVVRFMIGESGRLGASKFQRLARHLRFAEIAATRDRLDHVPVAVAAGECHPRIGAGRILAQDLFDRAHRLDELAPVHCREITHAADAVADRHLIRRLALVLDMHHAFDRLLGLAQPLLDPAQWQRQRRALPLQPARQFGDERPGQRRI